MGKEPVEKDIPIEPGDLSLEAQQALMLFSVLPDMIEGMNGIWLGKSFSGIGDIFDFYEIEDRREVFELLTYIINQYMQHHENLRSRRQSG
jgi:hypothetical protein